MLNQLIEKDLEIWSLDKLLARLVEKLEDTFSEDNISLAFVQGPEGLPIIGMYLNLCRAIEIQDLITEVKEAAKRHEESDAV